MQNVYTLNKHPWKKRRSRQAIFKCDLQYEYMDLDERIRNKRFQLHKGNDLNMKEEKTSSRGQYRRW